MRLLPNPHNLILTINGRTYTGQVGVPMEDVPDQDGAVLSANGWTVLLPEAAYGSSGASAFTDLTDAPSTITPLGLVVGNIAGDGVEMPDWIKVQDTDHNLFVQTANNDPEGNGAQLSVEALVDGVGTTRGFIYAEDGAVSLGLYSGVVPGFELNVDVDVEFKKTASATPFVMTNFDVAASDATATMTVNAVEYGIAKAIQVKIGAQTFFWPLFGPVA